MHSDGLARISMLALVVAFFTCEARANLPAPDEHERTAFFDPDEACPEPGSPVARVREALSAGELEKARKLAEKQISSAPPATRGRLRWLAAEAALRSADFRGGAAHLSEIVASGHPLSPWARLKRAELFESSEPERAAREAHPLTKERWPGQWRARIVEARSLARAGKIDEAVPKLRKLVEETAATNSAATTALPLADLLAQRESVAEKEEAIRLYRRVATRTPLTTIGRDALAKVDALLETLPAEDRARLAELTYEEAFAEGQSLFNAVRHAEAEAAFAALAERVKADPEKSCAVRLMQGKAMLRRRDRQTGTEHMKKVAEECPNPEIRAPARYLAGRAFSARGENDAAIAEFDALERETPEHTLADDALFRSALVAGHRGDTKEVERRLRLLPERYPTGDMRAEARFMLAWNARRESRFAEALVELERLLAEGPGEDAEDLRGRAAYWRARTLADLGRVEEALIAFETLVLDWPLAYYAQQALARLDEMAPERASRFRDSLKGGGGDERLRFVRRAEMEHPGFARAIELLQVGEVDSAMQEFNTMGATGEAADADLLWALAAMLHRTGALPQASRLVRHRLSTFRTTLPLGRGRALWRLAYPKAYEPLIEEAAKEARIPPSFLRAIAREESAFDPGAVSIAQAYGLIQVIEPTAKRFAKELGLPSDPASLKNPAINLRIGAQFLAYLFKRYEANPALVPSAYNAGEGATGRWLKQRSDLPLDVFIEEIPYDETRRYTRRVLQTWGVYSVLEEGTLPSLAARLP